MSENTDETTGIGCLLAIGIMLVGLGGICMLGWGIGLLLAGCIVLLFGVIAAVHS